LADVLPSSVKMDVYNAYDIVGDIAIIRLTESSMSYRQAVAEALMSVHRNVKTVLVQTGPVHGDYRLRKLEYVAGIDKATTVHKEAGCILGVDVEKCYFSPRLLFERARIARLVRNGETILNMFAGVGSFSIIIARHSAAERIFCVDVNPIAIQFMQKNVRLNKVYGKVLPVLGDAGQIIEEKLNDVADRVLMPLPEKAIEYLQYALLALKKTGGWIHYYDFEHATEIEDPIEKAKSKVAKKMESSSAVFEFAFGRIVRPTGPNWYQIVLDIHVKSLGKF
jgi:tRNA (guanine37-N1)-methyltransferase